MTPEQAYRESIRSQRLYDFKLAEQNRLYLAKIQEIYRKALEAERFWLAKQQVRNGEANTKYLISLNPHK